MMTKTFKISISAMLIAGAGFSASAQKNIQETGVRAPQGIKVDGKLTEWNDNFEATNKTTLLTYTISNDDTNLYLAIKSTDQQNSNKITAGGISFTINTAGKKKTQDAFGLVFPLISPDAMRGMFGRGQGGQGGGQGTGGGFGGGFGGGDRGGFNGGQGGQRPQMDSATLAARRTAAVAAAKEIKLVGFKDIPDSVISVYNDYSIKAALGYDAKGNLTYELSIPLKTLGLSTDSPKEFAYNLKVNGLQFNRDRGGDRQDNGGDRGGQGGGDRGGNGGGGQGGGAGGFGGGAQGGGGFGGGGRGGNGGGGFGGPGGPGGGMQSMLTPTDFWGKYTLVKK